MIVLWDSVQLCSSDIGGCKTVGGVTSSYYFPQGKVVMFVNCVRVCMQQDYAFGRAGLINAGLYHRMKSIFDSGLNTVS